MPLKMLVPESVIPSNMPLAMVARGAFWADAVIAKAGSTAMAYNKMRRNFFMMIEFLQSVF
jgi:hypothetical protein